MSGYKYLLGAAVILATSIPAAVQQLHAAAEDEAEDKRLAGLSEAEREAELTKGVTMTRFFAGNVEEGTVVGRSEYIDAPPSYLVSYRDGSGNDREEWFVERRLATWEDAEQHFQDELHPPEKPETPAPEPYREEGDRPGTDVLNA